MIRLDDCVIECSSFIVYESFKEYVTPEKLEGDNKYDAGEFGMQVSNFSDISIVFQFASEASFCTLIKVTT